MARPPKPRGKSRPNQQSRPPGAGSGGQGENETASAQRLQKVLAAAGVASRRDCEELIREGRVEVDKQVVTELGTRVDPLQQEIRVDGEPLRRPKKVYFALNKPVDVVCTNFDPSGRARVIDLVPNHERVFAVGRLDRASEGLILVTNDGSFANHVTHPRYGVEKTYLVRVAGRPGPEQLAKLRRGVHLAEGFCKVESVVVKGRHKQSTDLLMVLDEGRNREIRRVLAKVGHKVVTLKRIMIGGLKIGPLEPGEWRKLSPDEIEALLAISRKKRKDKKKIPPKPTETGESETGDDEVSGEEPLRLERPPQTAKKPAKPRGEAAEKQATDKPPGKKPPSASSIAAKIMAGQDFEDEDDDFLDSFAGDDDFEGDEDEEGDEFDDDESADDESADDESADDESADDESDDDESDDDESDDDDGADENDAGGGIDVDEDLEIGELRDDDLVKETMILAETPDTPPRSGPAPRGGVIDFDEDSPPPLQPKRVREQRSSGPQPRQRAPGTGRPARGDRPPQRREEPRDGRRDDRNRTGRDRPDRAERQDRGEGPLRAEPRGDHRHRGVTPGARSGQAQRRGQRHRSAEEFDEQTTRRPRSGTGRPGAARPGSGRNAGANRGASAGLGEGQGTGRGASRGVARGERRGPAGRDDARREDSRRGENPRGGFGRGANPRGEQPAEGDRPFKGKGPRRPGKLVAARPQEERGARGKYPGKSIGKGKREEFGGGGRGSRTIFGKRVKKRGKS